MRKPNSILCAAVLRPGNVTVAVGAVGLLRRLVRIIRNRIKELHDLEIDRTSCTSFWANQFRVLLTAAAYVLMQELRLRAAGTVCARAQVGMLRERLLKARGSSVSFGTTDCRSSARVVSVSTGLPTSRAGTGRCHWITRRRDLRTQSQ